MFSLLRVLRGTWEIKWVLGALLALTSLLAVPQLLLGDPNDIELSLSGLSQEPDAAGAGGSDRFLPTRDGFIVEGSHSPSFESRSYIVSLGDPQSLRAGDASVTLDKDHTLTVTARFNEGAQVALNGASPTPIQNGSVTLNVPAYPPLLSTIFDSFFIALVLLVLAYALVRPIGRARDRSEAAADAVRLQGWR